MEKGVEEAASFGLGGSELGFQLVAEGHEFFDFGDDAVLFGEGRQRGNMMFRSSSSLGGIKGS